MIFRSRMDLADRMAHRCQEVSLGLMEVKAAELHEVLAWMAERLKREGEGTEEDCHCPGLRVLKEDSVFGKYGVAGCVVVPFHLPQDVADQSEICSLVHETVRNWR